MVLKIENPGPYMCQASTLPLGYIPNLNILILFYILFQIVGYETIYCDNKK
jgi:hypothetical protein